MNIAIIGDSFACDYSEGSWISLLMQDHNITNYSARGISEYRLYKMLMSDYEQIQKADCVIVFHTNPDRVYIPSGVDYPTRKLDSHPHADMVANDILSNARWAKNAEVYYKNFYDQDLQDTLYDFLVEDIAQALSNQKTIMCSGFALESYPAIYSFASVREKHPGDINHLDINGNLAVYNYIKKNIEE